jgi:sialate O-acetylesterase
MTRYLPWLAMILAGRAALGEVRLPAIFSDHMVLQRGMDVPVWGWASAGEEVTVTIAGQTRKAVAGADGKWMVRMSRIDAAAPLRLTVAGTNTLEVEDVLAGEVWLCSGQSNMAFRVSQAYNSEQEQAAANFPQIRMFLTERKTAKEPQTDAKGKWIVASPETAGAFTAAGYFFAREIHNTLHVPVGLVHSSVGGTAIELWISADAQRNSAELRPEMEEMDRSNREFDAVAAKARYDVQLARWQKTAAAAKASGKPAPRAPQDPVALQERKTGIGVLYNGMIAPLIPYALRGALWYQGEANSTAERAKWYQYQLPLLIKDWRTRWGQGNFPFAWVQLPNFEGPGRNWPLVREAMLKTLSVPNTGMAVAIDVGDPGNIHPTHKQEVGKRLSMWALGAVYGKKCETSGPLAAGQTVKHGSMVIRFKHTDGGLVSRDGELRGFQIAGADKRWVPASAIISGATVIVSSPEVTEPIAVRYAWSNNPQCNLFNGAGIPASPFRTDDWE